MSDCFQIVANHNKVNDSFLKIPSLLNSENKKILFQKFIHSLITTRYYHSIFKRILNRNIKIS